MIETGLGAAQGPEQLGPTPTSHQYLERRPTTSCVHHNAELLDWKVSLILPVAHARTERY